MLESESDFHTAQCKSWKSNVENFNKPLQNFTGLISSEEL